MEFALYYPSTEELETVISNLATRDELRRQQLCSVPKKYEFLGLRSESRPFFGKSVRKWSDFGQNEIYYCLKFSDLFAKKSRFWTKAQEIKPFGNTALLASSRCT